MVRFRKKISQKVGLPPGTLVHVGERKTEEARLRVIKYDEERFEERDVRTVEECFPLGGESTKTWINVDGLHELDIIETIGNHLDLHPLVLEDIVHTGQRPKMEDFEDYIFIVTKMLLYDDEKDQLEAEQVSLVLGRNYVVSFQEREGDVFEPVRERLRKGKGRIRKVGPDYLAYALMDAIIDNYFIILERLGERIETLEEELMTNPGPETLQTIHHLKRELIFLRRSVWPLREVVSALERGESGLIEDTTAVFLRDIYDHTIQIIEADEAFRDTVSGMLDIYLSSISNRMNQVMKVLTIIATIFIPITFIAGVYGMNFKFMPELEWHWGYPLVWSTMIAIGVIMLVYFRRRKWF